MYVKKASAKNNILSKSFDIANYLFFFILSVLFAYPFYQLMVLSFNEANDAIRGGIYFWPRQWSLNNYLHVFKNPLLLNSYLVTISRTVIGAITSVLATGMFAYGLSKKHLVFRRFYLVTATITMFFSGGLIPYYILIYNLHLNNSFLVYIIPSLIGVWNMLIMKTFFQSIPSSLEDSAKIDGYNDMQIFFKVIIPTATPILAAISLFNGVGQWNSWFDAYLFIDNTKLLPLQTILMKIIMQSSAVQELTRMAGSSDALRFKPVTPEALKLSTMMVCIGPILLIYPFLQKYFIKGIMIGSIKE